MNESATTKKGRVAELLELRTLLPYLRKYRGRVIIGVIFIVLTNFFALLGPRLLQYAIDSLREDLTARPLLYFAALILGVSLAEGFFRFWMRQTIIVVSRFIEYELRNDYFKHLQRMSRSFFNRIATGDLMARAGVRPGPADAHAKRWRNESGLQLLPIQPNVAQCHYVFWLAKTQFYRCDRKA